MTPKMYFNLSHQMTPKHIFLDSNWGVSEGVENVPYHRKDSQDTLLGPRRPTFIHFQNGPLKRFRPPDFFYFGKCHLFLGQPLVIKVVFTSTPELVVPLYR